MSPRDQQRQFPPEYAHELLRIAGDDHVSAAYLRTGLSRPGVRPENVAYLFQQAIEKALKAVLCAQGLPVPLVHDLGVLVAKLPDLLDPDFGYELAGLDEYATVRRYEEGRYTLTAEEIAAIEALSTRVLAWSAGVVAKE